MWGQRLGVRGLGVRGLWVQRLWVQRLWVQRLWVQRLWVQRLWVQRLWVQRLWVQRLWVQRLWVQGRVGFEHRRKLGDHRDGARKSTVVGGGQSGDRLRYQASTTITPLLYAALRGSSQVKPHDPPVVSVSESAQQTGVGELPDESGHGIGGEPEVGGGLGDRDARAAADQSDQLDLRVRQSLHRPRPTHHSPRPPAEQPDRVEEVVGHRGVELRRPTCLVHATSISLCHRANIYLK